MNSTFWVFLCFAILVGIIIRKGGWTLVTSSLDNRSQEIKKTLEQARSLREEAQALLADYQRKTENIEVEAQEIVAQAKRDAEQMHSEAMIAVKEVVDRQIKSAEDKIANYQEQSIKEIKAYGANLAITAVKELLSARAAKDNGKAFADVSIAQILPNISSDNLKDIVKQR